MRLFWAFFALASFLDATMAFARWELRWGLFAAGIGAGQLFLSFRVDSGADRNGGDR